MDIENELVTTIKHAIKELGQKQTEAIITKIFSRQSETKELCLTCGCILDFFKHQKQL
jgi:hypothetical protein